MIIIQIHHIDVKIIVISSLIKYLYIVINTVMNVYYLHYILILTIFVNHNVLMNKLNIKEMCTLMSFRIL